MRIQICLAAFAASVAVASPALAQVVPPPVTDSDTATARGVVLGAHSLKKSRDLDFGVISVDNTGGTVSIAATNAGNRSVTGGVTGLTTGWKSAQFDGSAAPNEQVVLTMSGTPAGTLSLSDGAGHSIPATLTLDAAGATRNADSAGSFTVWVGGTFTIAPSQAAGVYSNTFDLTAEYQ